MSIHLIPPAIPTDCNVYLLKGTRNVLIDTGTGSRPDLLIGNIRGLLGDGALDLVLLTHCHADHVGGLGPVLAEFGAEAMAMPPDSQWIREADGEHTADQWILGRRLGPVDVADVHDGDRIDIGVHRLRFISTPGHTKGSMCIYDENTKAIFSGDTVFRDGFGRYDLPSGSLKELEESVDAISNIDILGLYPGHGECTEFQGRESVCRARMMIGDLS